MMNRLTIWICCGCLAGCGDSAGDGSGGSSVGGAGNGTGTDTAMGGGDSTATDTNTDTGTGTETGMDNCWEHDEATCGTDASCLGIDALEIIEDGNGGECVVSIPNWTTVGCMPSNEVCTGVVTYAASPQSLNDCWWFPSGCQPLDWVSCGQLGLPECP